MYCQNCGTENIEEAKFCRDCGFLFQQENIVKCPSCGKQNAQETKFCSNCGFGFLKNKPQVIEKKIRRFKILLGDTNRHLFDIPYKLYIGVDFIESWRFRFETLYEVDISISPKKIIKIMDSNHDVFYEKEHDFSKYRSDWIKINQIRLKDQYSSISFEINND